MSQMDGIVLVFYLTGASSIPNYDPTEWYTVSFTYSVGGGAVFMYFQVNGTNGDILAEAWASSYFSGGAFIPSYIGFVVDEGNAIFDYLLAATAPTAFPVTSTVTETVTSTVTNTENRDLCSDYYCTIYCYYY